MKKGIIGKRGGKIYRQNKMGPANVGRVDPVGGQR